MTSKGLQVAAARRGTQRTPTRGAAIPQLAWYEVRPAPVVLVSGAQDLFADRAIKGLRDFLRAEDPSLEVSDIDAGAYQPGELLTLASPSLFAEPRLIRVSNVEKCTDAFLTEALGYLTEPAESAYLVLRHGGGVRGKKLLDAIRAASGIAIEILCADLKKDSEKYDFAKSEFQRADKRITPAALRQIVSAFSDDVAELAAACQQLISDSAQQITEETVDSYYGGRVETTAFVVADSAIAGRAGEALIGLRHALSSGADPVPIVAAFAMKVRTMAKVSGAYGPSAQIAGQLGMAPWQVDRAKRDLQGWTDDGLGRAIIALAEADAAVKGAGRDPVFAIEKLIGVISARGRS